MEGEKSIGHVAYTCKLVVMGPPKSGKSTLIDIFVHEGMPDSRRSYFPLFLTKRLTYGDKSYAINIWDSTNTDTPQSVNKVYYRDANIVFLVYDLMNAAKAIYNLNAWYNMISQYAQDKCGMMCDYHRSRSHRHEG